MKVIYPKTRAMIIGYVDIFQAIAKNDIDAVKKYIEVSKVPITIRNDEHETLAHFAVKKCLIPHLKYFLQVGPELQDMRDMFGNTILHLAVLECGSLELLKYLIKERGMDLYDPASPHLGNGPVHFAAHAGRMQMLKYFFEEKQVDVNLRNRIGQPIAFAAALNRKFHVIRYLLERNANFFLTDHNNDNILLISARIGDLSVPYYLLEEKRMKFDLNWKDRFGGTALHQAARHNHLVVVKYFVAEKKLDFNEQDIIGRTPLHEATEQNNFYIVKYLMERGASVFVRDNFGKTPLQVTTDKRIIQYLKQYLPPDRKRRSIPEPFFLPPVEHNNVIQQHIADAKSARETPSSLPLGQHINSFLLLTNLWVKNVISNSSSLLTPPQSIQNRIDVNAIEAVNAFTIFGES